MPKVLNIKVPHGRVRTSMTYSIDNSCAIVYLRDMVHRMGWGSFPKDAP